VFIKGLSLYRKYNFYHCYEKEGAMKKIILITIVCFLIPCFVYAQEPDSNLSIEGTLWRTRVFGAMNLPDGLPHVVSEVWMVGFYDEKVYLCLAGAGDTCEPVEDSAGSQYIDGPVISIWYNFGLGTAPEQLGGIGYLLAIIQPMGFGYLTSSTLGFLPGDERPKFVYAILTGSMVKESDNWSP
jgi:hypothetical protein